MKSPDIDGASIVMIGSFNPAIFQPRWLGAQHLIRPEEAESAKIAIIQAEVADFSTEWFHLIGLQNRFEISCADPGHYAPLRDLAGAIFAILPHTPVKRLGLNRTLHFKMPSVDSWHGIGNLLAPKGSWAGIMEEPGLRSMLMQGHRKQSGGGVLHIKVEPSVKLEQGLYIEVNEEFQAPHEGEPEGAQWVPNRLAEHWDAVMKYSEVAAEHLLGLVRN